MQPVSRAKRRACDECRSRKLACSKEPDGCARCTREGIVCHYSAQKPMGRPRRQHTVALASARSPTLPSAAAAGVSENDTLQWLPHPPPPAPAGASGVMSSTTSAGLELDAGAPLSLLEPSLGADVQMPDVTSADFLDFFGIFDSDATYTTPQPLDVAKPAPENPMPPPPAPQQQQQQQQQTWEPRSCMLGLALDADVDFSLDPNLLPPPPADVSSGGHGVAGLFPADVNAPAPALDPAMSPTAVDSMARDVPLQPVTCSCLANLYLALDSIARLPGDIMPAMRVARSACKVAHDAIRCQVCCPPPRHAPARLAPATLQNMMIVGALVPSIADAYGRILVRIDEVAARATAASPAGGHHARLLLPFSLSAYGGLSGSGAGAGAGSDPAAAPPPPCRPDGGNDDGGSSSSSSTPSGSGAYAAGPYENKMLDPAQWRVALRALLRIDVYGLNCDPDPVGAGGASGTGAGSACAARSGLCFSRMGLRDLVAQMDDKSRSRHAEIDAMIDAGLLTPRGTGRLRPCHTRSLEEKGRVPHCRFIIDVAKEAVEDLVIA